MAFEALSQLDLDPDDLELAQDLLTTLFLWYLTFLEQPRRLSLSDLVEATLTTEGVLRSDDNVELVLTSMQALPQVDVSERSAVFVPAGSDTGPQVLNLFQEQKRQALRDQHKVRKSLAESLFWNPRSTGGVKGLFADYTPDATKAHQVRSRNLEYPGELVIASTWRLDHGLALNSSSETHFRLVILTPDAAHTVQAHDLQDARIAVVVPGEMSEETRTAVVEYVAWHNLEQEYSAQVGRDAEDVRSWLDSRKQTIVNQVATTHLQVYQSGRILTRDNLGISASEIFGQGGDNDVRIAAIVDRLLQAVYRQVPVATDSFRSALTANETGKVFEGYFNPKATTAQTTATKNYGVGLGLSAADKPSHFAPQAPPVFTLIESMLADRAGRDLPVWQIVDRLAAPPYGLPYVVIQLYLLAFVRRGTPRVDLTLKVRHTLKLRTGQPVTRDRLTASSVVDLDWKAGLHDKFDALVPSSGPIWNDTLAYAREMTDRLTATTDQVDIEQQTQELIKALRELKEHLVRQRESLKVLAETLHMPLPATASADLDRLAQLTADLPDGYADFHERAETIFADSPEQLRASMQTFQRVRDLTDYAAAINQAHSYLTAVALRPGDTGLAAERNDVLSQLTLPLLVEQPEIWPQRLRHAFDSFKTHYRNAYQKHHRDYYETMTSLTNRLADARNRRDVLTLLNQIEGIGGAVGDDLERRWKAVEDVLRLCSIRDVLAVNVDASPVCAACGLRLTDSPPEDRVRDLLRDLDTALAQKQRQLASQPVTQVLHDTGLHDLAEAAAAPDLTRLIEIVTPDLIELAKLAMEEAQIYTVDAPVLADIRQTYPTIAEADISQVVADFETRLRDAFRRAGKPGKKNIRITLH